MSDIDKIYNLLERVYVELQDTKKEIKDTKNEVKDNSKRLDNVEAGQKKLETILEHDIKSKLQALHEKSWR